MYNYTVTRTLWSVMKPPVFESWIMKPPVSALVFHTLGPVHTNVVIFKTAAFSMRFGRLSTRKHSTRSLKRNIFENSCQGELRLQCYRVDSETRDFGLWCRCYLRLMETFSGFWLANMTLRLRLYRHLLDWHALDRAS